MLHDRFNISFSFRLFVLYFVSVAVLAVFLVNEAVKQTKQSNLQSAETLLIDLSQLMAASIEAQLAAAPTSKSVNPVGSQIRNFASVVERVMAKRFTAQIYDVDKRRIDIDIYITDDKGIVVYDSRHLNEGEDFSQWNDVYLTLRGQYGARVSLAESAYFRKTGKAADPDGLKEMVVAAPIMQGEKIIGVVSVVYPTQKLNNFLLSGERSLRSFMFIGIGLALLMMLMMSWWLTRTLKRLANYATAMAERKDQTEIIHKPTFLDSRLAELTHSIEYLREALDGKSYVENYVHSLTHELKNPIAGIHAAIEILDDDTLSAEERAQFVQRIGRSTDRLSSLVNRMLQLAQLENQQDIERPQSIALDVLVQDIVADYQSRELPNKITLALESEQGLWVSGDRLLLNQALHNVLDNALDFATPESVISLKLFRESERQEGVLQLDNEGAPIPEYAVERVFERFFSLPRPDTQKRSTGLGLSFVRQILQLHRGQVSLANHETGVRVTWRLPLATKPSDVG